MSELAAVAPAFVAMAHRIVWANVATVDADGRPWSRILHPLWAVEDDALVGWIATGPTPLKRAHLDHSPYVSVTYWSPEHDTCTAECAAEWLLDDTSRIEGWERFEEAPAPVGYDPAIVKAWADGPTSPAFASPPGGSGSSPARCCSATVARSSPGRPDPTGDDDERPRQDSNLRHTV